MRLTLAVLLCSLADPAFAAPDVNSANFILPHCKLAQQPDKPPGFMSGLCAGIVDALVGVSSVLPERMRFCPASEQHECTTAASGRALRGEAPDRLHENFKHFVVDALRETWPCP